jgi:phosphatidylethanolamine-binding protein (PEBP) family uncharacterized protein
MNSALVVMIDPDLPTYRRNGLIHAIVTTLPDVQSVAAIESISAETLLAMLLKPIAEPQAPTEPRQAGLFEEALA